MNKFLQYSFFIILLVATAHVKAQTTADVVQLYGVIMTSDSLKAIPMASVVVMHRSRGTFSNDQGVFSIVVLKGDTVRFSCVGFKDHVKVIPHNLEGNQYSVIQLLVSDTAYLPVTILKPRPTRAQFDRDFVNTEIEDDQIAIARKNTDAARLRALLHLLPPDGREAVAMQMRQQATRATYQGQPPPINIFNPLAWASFIQAWKRGDFKKKSD